MTKPEFQALVKETIESLQGCKVNELAAMEEIACASFNLWADALSPLILSGDVIEIEYTVPHVPNRLKSFLLPKGSTIRVVQGG